MKKSRLAGIVVVAVLAWSGALAAHHSLVQFDTTTPLRVKGTVVRFDLVNPHVRFVLDQKTEDGQTQRWVVDGPPSNNLARMGIGPDFLKAGDVIEVCGFALKEEFASQRALPRPDSASDALSGRALSGHLLVMPGGKRRYWSDYGVLHKCLNPGGRGHGREPVSADQSGVGRSTKSIGSLRPGRAMPPASIQAAPARR